jgi:hypothetical protein
VARAVVRGPVVVVVVEVPLLAGDDRQPAPDALNLAGQHFLRPNSPRPLMRRPIAASRRLRPGCLRRAPGETRHGGFSAQRACRGPIVGQSRPKSAVCGRSWPDREPPFQREKPRISRAFL